KLHTCLSTAGPAVLLLVGSLATGSSALAAGASGPLVAHKAFYEMEMGDKVQNSHIVSVMGRSVFAMERDCTGWRSIEDYMVQFIVENGGADRILSHFESWEADSGDKYSFDIMEESSFEGRKDFGGFVQLDTGSAGEAVFTTTPDTVVDLPTDTVFPVRHVQRILAEAEAGAKMISANVFTGAEPDSALMRTSTVVGGWRDEPGDDELGQFGEDGYWQINVAYFKPAATTSEPEYVIKFQMQRNGLVRGYEIDYGDFSIEASLTSVEPVETQSCS
ncbi:MAG: EipB family protein, partial [Candidatus Puniceispirillaceae bacterium]